MALLLGELPRRLAAVLGPGALIHLELERRSKRLAHALRALGLGRGERLLCWSETRPDMLSLFAACAKIGATFAPASERLTAAEVEALAEVSRPALAVADGARAEAARAGLPLAGAAAPLQSASAARARTAPARSGYLTPVPPSPQ